MDITGGTQHTVNIDLSTAFTGLASAGGLRNEAIRFDFTDISTDKLGRSSLIQPVATTDAGAANNGRVRSVFYETGGQVLGITAISDLGSGGPSDVFANKFEVAVQTIDRAVDFVIEEERRLAVLQNFFSNALIRTERQISELASDTADIINVDAAKEITELIAAQAHISTVVTVLGQTNAITSSIYSLVNGLS